MTATPLLDWQPPSMDRGGSTYDHARDFARLNTQQEKVWAVVRDGQWHTLADIAEKTGCPEASVSARLRDLRKMGCTVEHECIRRGLWRYRVTR